MGIDALALDLESEEFRLRRLEGIASTMAALPMPAKPVPSGLSPVSTISKAAAPSQPETRERAQIERPKHFMYGIIRTHDQLEKTADKQSRIFEEQLKVDFAEIDRLDAEKLEKLKKHAEKVKSQSTWDVICNIAGYVAAGTSIILGAAAIAALPALPWVGGMLIASGAVGILGKAAKDTGLLQAVASWIYKSEEMQKKLAARIEMGMFFLSLGFGLAGGIGAAANGAFAAINAAARIGKLAEGIQLGTSVANASARMPHAFIEKDKSQIQADLSQIEVRTNGIYQSIYRNTKDVQQFMDMTGDISEQVKDAVSMSRVSQDF